jgi:hypothetical protein
MLYHLLFRRRAHVLFAALDPFPRPEETRACRRFATRTFRNSAHSSDRCEPSQRYRPSRPRVQQLDMGKRRAAFKVRPCFYIALRYQPVLQARQEPSCRHLRNSLLLSRPTSH